MAHAMRWMLAQILAQTGLIVAQILTQDVGWTAACVLDQTVIYIVAQILIHTVTRKLA